MRLVSFRVPTQKEAHDTIHAPNSIFVGRALLFLEPHTNALWTLAFLAHILRSHTDTHTLKYTYIHLLWLILQQTQHLVIMKGRQVGAVLRPRLIL